MSSLPSACNNQALQPFSFLLTLIVLGIPVTWDTCPPSLYVGLELTRRSQTRCARCFAPGLNPGAGEVQTLCKGKPLLDPDQWGPSSCSLSPRTKLPSPRARHHSHARSAVSRVTSVLVYKSHYSTVKAIAPSRVHIYCRRLKVTGTGGKPRNLSSEVIKCIWWSW